MIIFIFSALLVFKICAFQVQETVDFSGRSFPYKISKSGDKIPNF